MKKFEQHKFVISETECGSRVEFRPAHSPRVTFYSCGPTVYGPLHIGNARALITADLMFRWLKYIGYEVNFVRNYTDVDDKIITRSLEEKISADEVSQKYIDYCETDVKRLGLQPPTKIVRVTESIDDIIAMIKRIIERKHAYTVEADGGKQEVLFDISSFKTYGKLSGKKTDDLQAGARVEVDARKKNPLDFALWKPAKPGEPYWESPWGNGRPGWHIECSAMASRWLGETIDLHHGGQDLIFPHHENEIAQSESASGKPFCKHWIHNAFLLMGKEKMSKSLGNLLTMREFMDLYSPEILKYIYVAHHFRSAVEFNDKLILRCIDELERVYQFKKWAEEASNSAGNDATSNEKFSALKGSVLKACEKIEIELFNDLNSPGALGHLFTLIRDANRVEVESSGKAGVLAQGSQARREFAAQALMLLDKTLFELWNVFGTKAEKMLSELNVLRGSMKTSTGSKSIDEEAIQNLIAQRAEARKNKDFKRSDEIRNELDASGVVLIDSPTGTTWKYK